MYALFMIYLKTFASRIIRIRIFDNALLPKSSLAINGDNVEHKRRKTHKFQINYALVLQNYALHLLVSEIYPPLPLR